MKEALLYEKLEGLKVHCFLCNHHCVISDEKLGICNVRENRAGTLYTHSYSRLVAQNIDPIEKKPLYHFQPGSKSFSIAAVGCNFRCGFCQNWQISQVSEAKQLGVHPQEVSPKAVVQQAIRSGSKSISYTYTEPTLFFEYAYETSQLAKEKGIGNVFVTNGFMTEEMIRMIHPYLDAANIDLKAFNEGYYRKICGGKLQPVLKNIELMKALDVWIEITTLLVPGQNDSEEELKQIAGFLACIDKAIPWHISRFYPQYKMDDLESTPVPALNRAYQIGKKAGLRYVYLGNLMGPGNNSYCHTCDRLLIERAGFSISKYALRDGKCPSCHTPMDGVGLAKIT